MAKLIFRKGKMMKSVNKTKTLALALLLFAVLALTPAARAAEIWTDQEDYSPWELVTLSGSGFEPLSDMTVTVEGPGEWGIDEFYGTADDSGSFSFMYAKEKCEGTFTVTASDSVGNTARTEFTDTPLSDFVSFKSGMCQ